MDKLVLKAALVHAPLEFMEKNVMQVLPRAITFLHQWLWAREGNKPNQESQDQVNTAANTGRWKPPEQGYVKCNIDAALHHQNLTGIGLCLRGDDGTFLMARTLGFSPKLEAH